MDERIIAGTDEAGRGPLAGPVVAAAVILDPSRPITGLADSKVLSEKMREDLFAEIQKKALAWHIAEASVAEIDELNILQASLLAMRRSVEGLSLRPSLVLVDGNKTPELEQETKAIIQGDKVEPAISAASILAKVHRDYLMVKYDLQYPSYGFAQHKGYPTKQHLAVLHKHGVLDIHRKSFAPVKKALLLETA
jgi:ribonuclease HII